VLGWQLERGGRVILRVERHRAKEAGTPTSLEGRLVYLILGGVVRELVLIATLLGDLPPVPIGGRRARA
jgi:hypothetical protein